MDSYIVRIAYTWAPIQLFATQMDAHTLCSKEGVIRTSVHGFIASPPGAAVDVDKRAIVFYRDPDDLKVYHFSYPSPIAADLESKPSGIRMKDTAVSTIVGYISTMNAKTYFPLYGLYYQKV